MKYIIWISLSLIVLGIIYFIGVFVLDNEYFSQPDTNIIFLTQDQAIEFISSDPDGYVSRFNQLDYKARNINSPQDYTNLFVNNVIKPSSRQIALIENAIDQGYKLIAHIDSDDKIWLDIDKFINLPWKFIIIDSDLTQIDFGLSHTRYNTIVLHSDIIANTSYFINTLIHEQLHVYQKVYPEDFEKYLIASNFTRHIKYTDTSILYRSNPDTDEWIYKCGGEDIYYSEYILPNPKSICDVRYWPINAYEYEHPREKSVYNLLQKVKNSFKK